MKFLKYEGCGNDFILIDGISSKVEINHEWCQKVCDRHFEVGADGVLFVLPGREGQDLEMVVINADGSVAEMCGNGIRCVSKYARDFGLVKKDEFSVMTGKGILKANVSLDSVGKVETVRIDMGAPILENEKIPVKFDGKFVSHPMNEHGISFSGTAVSMGNPHLVIFDSLTQEQISVLGPILEKNNLFPKKTNVEFAKVENGKIDVKVFERGVGWTLACGTGACATTVAAALTGRVPFNEEIHVHLPGGWLKITVDKDLKYVLMEGPAKFVYEGEITNPKK